MATATLRTVVNSIIVNNPGEGYSANVQLQLVASLSGGGTSMISTSNNIATDAEGKLPSQIDLTVVDGGGGGFGVDDPGNANLPANAIGVQLVILSAAVPTTPAQLTSNIVTEVAFMNITNGGSGYTSAPTVTFSGPGSTNHATLAVTDFTVFWNIEPVNGPGSDYPLLPSLTISYPNTSQQTAAQSTVINGISAAGATESAGMQFQTAFSLNNGDLVKKFTALTYRTTLSRSVAPTVVVTQEVPEPFKLNFLPPAIDVEGRIIGDPSLLSFGNGYNAPIEATISPTITGAPGNGGSLSIGNNFNAANGEFSWNFGFTLTSSGSGYLQNLNQKSQQASSFPSNQLVQAGKSYTLDVTYGTGQRRVSIN
jgi:hypothetical protein